MSRRTLRQRKIHSLKRQIQIKEEAQQTFDEALAAKQAALVIPNSKESSLAAALLTKNQAYFQLQQAQSNYDNNLIPDPTYVAPTYQQQRTRQVPCCCRWCRCWSFGVPGCLLLCLL
jgi:hypothetical protein